jgi:membrane protease YdiL (CAAX protease family)
MENEKTPGSPSSFARIIEKIPSPITAVLLGILVYALGSFPSLAAVSIAPFPFSLLLLIIVLFFYLRYFSGRLGKKGPLSVRLRTENFRDIWLSGGTWKWAALGILLFVVMQQSMFVVTFRVFEYDPEVMITFQLGDHPVWLLWYFSVASALIAGISEEVGFRGYMQVPLEKKYKPWIANTIVSVIFLIFHLNQGWAVPSMYGILFVSSILIGMLVIASNSLLPGIIAHFAVDIFNFSYWWSDLAGKFEYRPIAETGIDAHFIIWLAAFILSVILIFLVIEKTKKERLRSA